MHNGFGNQFALFIVTKGTHYLYFITGLFFRKYILFKLFFIVGDDAVSNIYNVLCRPVILLKLKDSQFRIIFFEIQDILDVCSAERVDTLRIITHHTNILEHTARTA